MAGPLRSSGTALFFVLLAVSPAAAQKPLPMAPHPLLDFGEQAPAAPLDRSRTLAVLAVAVLSRN